MTGLPEKWSVPLDHGFSVIPVEAGGKKPLDRWKPYMTTAADRATVTEWATNNNCNVGIVTGRVSNDLVVADFDRREAEDEGKRRGLPTTATVKTARGRHYYLKCPPGRQPRKPSDFPKGMDLQFDNKFVVAPGSIHPDGTEYVWERHPDVYDIADCPEWLLEPSQDTRTKPVDERDEDDGPIITRKTLDELRDALSVIDADERDLWVRIGHNLKSLPGRFEDEGKVLWLEWSAKSDKFNEADALTKWDTFHPEKPCWRAVFAEASDNWGWVNPRKRKDTSNNSASPLSDRRFRPGNNLQPTEYVLDGFLAVGVSVIAGAWGAGKSINIIPLMASVAHLAPDQWGFRPVLRRRIIWITEAPEQAHDTLYSLSKVAGAAEWSEFDDWFHIYSSVRQDPTKLAEEVRDLADDLAWKNDDGFEVKPVLVFDTTSANIDIENENDNSQVGKAMAALKQSLRGLPVVLIGHTPKALTRADVNDMTFRGAGAWEADAVATYYLVHDRDTDMRFMAICKRRFNPAYTEIDFAGQSGSTVVPTPWGDPQTKHYLHGVPTRSNGEARRAARQERMEERREADQERAALQRQERVLAAIRDLVGNGEPPSRENIRAASGMAKNNCNATIDGFIESGVVVPHDLGDDHVERSGWGLRKPFPKIYLPQEVDLDAFTNRTGR